MKSYTQRRLHLESSTLGELRAALAVLADAPDSTAFGAPGVFGTVMPIAGLIVFVADPPAPVDGGEDLGPAPAETLAVKPSEPVNFTHAAAVR